MDDYYGGVTEWIDPELEAIEEEADLFEAEQRFQQGVWMDGNGSEISITEMTVSHLNNAIRYLRNCYEDDPKAQAWASKMEAELAAREEPTP